MNLTGVGDGTLGMSGGIIQTGEVHLKSGQCHPMGRGPGLKEKGEGKLSIFLSAAWLLTQCDQAALSPPAIPSPPQWTVVFPNVSRTNPLRPGAAFYQTFYFNGSTNTPWYSGCGSREHTLHLPHGCRPFPRPGLSTQ